MTRSLLVLLPSVALALAGCATFSGSAPSCDGFSRRPLNRSLWDWEGRVTAPPPDPTRPSAPGPVPLMRKGALEPAPSQGIASEATARPRAIALDVAGSYRRCG